MPGSTPNAVQRQLRRVRWRWNAREVSCLLLRTLGATTGAAAVLVLVALGSGPRAFTAAATVIGALLVAALAGTALGGRWRWLGRRGAHLRVDELGRLGGRLATAVELGRARTPGTEVRLLAPLLAAQNAALLPLWTPARVVPRVVPAGTRLAALGGLGALVAALAFGPRLLPPPAADAGASTEAAGRAERWTAAGTRREQRAADAADEPAAPADPAPPASWTEAVQNRLQAELWGETEALRARELARADLVPPAAADRRREAARRGRDGESTGRVEAGGPDAPAGDEEDPGARADDAAGGERGAPTRAAAARERADGTTADGAAEGAGTGTSPNLYAAPTAADAQAGDAPFTLGITANVRKVGGGPRRPSGPTPEQAPDAGPALAARQREETAVPRSPVPPEYEMIVGRLLTPTP